MTIALLRRIACRAALAAALVAPPAAFGQDLLMLKDGSIVEGVFILESLERIEFQRIIRGSSDNKFYARDDVIQRLSRPLPTVPPSGVVSVCGVTAEDFGIRLDGKSWSAGVKLDIDTRLQLGAATETACLLDAAGRVLWSCIPASRDSLNRLTAADVPVSWPVGADEPVQIEGKPQPRRSLERYDAVRRAVETLTLWRRAGGAWESFGFVVDPRAYKGGTGGCLIVRREPADKAPEPVMDVGRRYDAHVKAVAEAERLRREEETRIERRRLAAEEAARRAAEEAARQAEAARQKEIQKFRDQSLARLNDLKAEPVGQFNVHADWLEFWLEKGALKKNARKLVFTERKVAKAENLLYKYEGYTEATLDRGELGVFTVRFNFMHDGKGWTLSKHEVKTGRVGGTNEKELSKVTGDVTEAVGEVPALKP